jgi:ubiquinone/menaquinone biosynthesis C-methylase UbiE
MSSLSGHINELKASEAFNRQAGVFDELYKSNALIRYKRERVRDHMLWLLQPNSQVLELNCGTGEDAMFFAQRGHAVHATDISECMLRELKNKIAASDVPLPISHELCSFTALDFLKNKGPFDHIFSNFGGLNCTGELERVLASFPPLLKPNGIVTLVILSKFCTWETLLLFRGKFKTAFRRLFSSKGRTAHVEGKHFKCWYYSPSYVAKQLPDFEVLSVEGLCSLVPPSYIEGFDQRYPGILRFLQKKEAKLKSKWPWKSTGDYFIISLQKK